ncbi:MAG: RNA methyltransferase [Barnesiella sp.]|nr:RNA methyltransferase [Barnesiella sp.]
MDLTNNLRKQILSLNDTKHRRELNMFKAEGSKCVSDTIRHFGLRYLLATNKWIHENPEFAKVPELIPVTPKDMDRLSTMSTASQVIAVYDIPVREMNIWSLKDELILALDCVQDPGNLGTIIRTADWFGIRTILASNDTVDVYSPKVVQATMGAISRVAVHYCDLPSILESMNNHKIYGTFLDGENLYKADLSPTGVIIMGNEGRGISKQTAAKVNRRLLIPSYPPDSITSESLNVATAAAITVAEFRRQNGLINGN